MIKNAKLTRDYWTIPYLIVVPKYSGEEMAWPCRVIGRTQRNNWAVQLYSEPDCTGGLNKDFIFEALPEYLWDNKRRAETGFQKFIVGEVAPDPKERAIDDWFIETIDEYAGIQDRSDKAGDDSDELDPCDDYEDQEHWSYWNHSGESFSLPILRQEIRRCESFINERRLEWYSIQEAERRDQQRRAERDAAQEQAGADGELEPGSADPHAGHDFEVEA